jgi:hypothetical protein
MVTFKRTFTRPSTDVLWYNQTNRPSASFLSAWTDYVGQNKVAESTTYTVDGLTMIYQATWSSLEDFHHYDHNPELDAWWVYRDEYNAANSIIMGEKKLEITRPDGSVDTVILPEGNWNLSDYQ